MTFKELLEGLGFRSEQTMRELVQMKEKVGRQATVQHMTDNWDELRKQDYMNHHRESALEMIEMINKTIERKEKEIS
jgi:hypothetical protein